MLVGAAAPIFAVVVVRTGVTLATEAGWLLTQLRLVVGQHVVVVCGRRRSTKSEIICGSIKATCRQRTRIKCKAESPTCSKHFFLYVRATSCVFYSTRTRAKAGQKLN